MTKWQSKQLGNNGMIFSAIVIPIIREIMLFKGESLRKYERKIYAQGQNEL